MAESRFDIVLDIVRANQEDGRTRDDTVAKLLDIVLDDEGRAMVELAARIVFDGTSPLP